MRKKDAKSRDSPRSLAVNRQARRDYEIVERFEAGVVLSGTETKSCRAGRIQLKDAYARFDDGELWLHNCHIATYDHASKDVNHEPERPRKLLLRRLELRRLIGKIERSGFTLVPLRVYLKGPWVKVELALARGRARHEKKEQLKLKIQQREIEQALRNRR